MRSDGGNDDGEEGATKEEYAVMYESDMKLGRFTLQTTKGILVFSLTDLTSICPKRLMFQFSLVLLFN